VGIVSLIFFVFELIRSTGQTDGRTRLAVLPITTAAQRKPKYRAILVLDGISLLRCYYYDRKTWQFIVRAKEDDKDTEEKKDERKKRKEENLLDLFSQEYFSATPLLKKIMLLYAKSCSFWGFAPGPHWGTFVP